MNSAQRRKARRAGTLPEFKIRFLGKPGGFISGVYVKVLPRCPTCNAEVIARITQFGQDSFECRQGHWGPWNTRIQPSATV